MTTFIPTTCVQPGRAWVMLNVVKRIQDRFEKRSFSDSWLFYFRLLCIRSWIRWTNFHHLLTIFQFPAATCIWQMDVSKGDGSILSIFSYMLWHTPHVLQAAMATSDRWILIDLCVLETTVVKGKQSGRGTQPKGVEKTVAVRMHFMHKCTTETSGSIDTSCRLDLEHVKHILIPMPFGLLGF